MRLTAAFWRLLPAISIAVFALGARPRSSPPPARRSATTSSPTTRPPRRVLDGKAAYDTSFQGAGGFGLFYYPPTFIPFVLPFGLLARRDGDVDLDRAAGRGVRDRDGADAGVIADAVADRAAGGALVAVPVRREARPGRAAAVSAVRRGLARDPGADGAGRERRPRGGDQDAARAGPGVGAPHRAHAGGASTGSWCSRSWRVIATILAGSRAWSDFFALIGRVSDPITTPHNFTPGRGRLPGRGVRATRPQLIQWACDGARAGRVRRRRRCGCRPCRRTSSRWSRASCCRRSCGTTTRCCCCCRSRGCWIAAGRGRC